MGHICAESIVAMPVELIAPCLTWPFCSATEWPGSLKSQRVSQPYSQLIVVE